MVVGDKTFMRAEGTPRDEGKKVMLAGSKWRLTPRSWTWPVILDEDSRWREHTVVEWITIDLKARWRIVGYALKSR